LREGDQDDHHRIGSGAAASVLPYGVGWSIDGAPLARQIRDPASVGDFGSRSLLQIDAGLTAAVPAGDRPQAARVRVPTFVISPGVVELELCALSESAFALLTISGSLTQAVHLSDRTISELLLAGDLFAPWKPAPATPERRSRLTALEHVDVAVLDHHFIKAAACWPELMICIHRRLNDHQHRLATHGAICQLPRVAQRVVAIMWHLAARTGRITADGMVVPHPLSHCAIADLIGAQRSTISLAAKHLEAEGHLIRRADGTWLLPGFSDGVTFDGLTAIPSEL
jgi:CRP-like cAMP-binding protein